MAIAEHPSTNVALDIPPGFWEREDSHNPRPMTPLGSSIFVVGLNRSFPKVFAKFGLILETLAFREIGGYVYNAAIPLGAKVGDQPRGLPPAPLLWVALRTVPMFRSRLGQCKTAMRTRADVKLVDQWLDEWRPRLNTEIARLRKRDLTSMTDEQLSAHLAELRDWTFDAFDVHFLLAAPYSFALAKLSFFCRDHLGYDDLQVTRLLSGLSEASSEPAIALAALADRIRAEGNLRDAVLAAEPRAVPEIVRKQGPAVAAAYDDYIHRYAFRALRYEVIEKTMDEEPELVARLLQDQLRHPADVRTEQAQLARERAEAKDAALARLPDDAAKARFHELLADAERVYPTREDNEFFTVSVPLALLRRVSLEAGRRLVNRHVIAAADDVFFLRVEEVIDALARHPRDDVPAQRVSERRTAFEAAERFSPPPSYGVEPALPPFWVLPPEARDAMAAMQFAREKIFELEREDEVRDTSDPRVVHGRAAARGTYSGTVRIIMGEHEFDKIQSGDVLVCPITSPVWSVLFAKVGALVTDSGGILSHPAIIAREYGIPAVVATRTATARLHDNQRVTVDGNAGIVRVLD
jgi:pyruvate,water dikinase